jgi:hypothetical protein
MSVALSSSFSSFCFPNPLLPPFFFFFKLDNTDSRKERGTGEGEEELTHFFLYYEWERYTEVDSELGMGFLFFSGFVVGGTLFAYVLLSSGFESQPSIALPTRVVMQLKQQQQQLLHDNNQPAKTTVEGGVATMIPTTQAEEAPIRLRTAGHAGRIPFPPPSSSSSGITTNDRPTSPFLSSSTPISAPYPPSSASSSPQDELEGGAFTEFVGEVMDPNAPPTPPATP